MTLPQRVDRGSPLSPAPANVHREEGSHQGQKPPVFQVLAGGNDPDRDRTCDLAFRKRSLYPTELRGRDDALVRGPDRQVKSGHRHRMRVHRSHASSSVAPDRPGIARATTEASMADPIFRKPETSPIVAASSSHASHPRHRRPVRCASGPARQVR
jgi:hypothetical protein